MIVSDPDQAAAKESIDEIGRLEARLGITFKDHSLLVRALTHRSFVNENPDQSLEDNERLEFLGDAVLDFAVGAYLYHRFPERREGELTMLRAALVRTRTLASFAKQLGVGLALRLGVGEAESGGRDRLPTLCAAFEALVGAIYLDRGMSEIEPWLQPLITPALERILANSTHKDAKSEFQIWAQARFNVTPRYKVLAAEGPDHDKTFTVAVLVGDQTWGTGRGSSKQGAAQVAASAALARVEELDLEHEQAALEDLDVIR
jgi:ribonuclease-3